MRKKGMVVFLSGILLISGLCGCMGKNGAENVDNNGGTAMETVDNKSEDSIAEGTVPEAKEDEQVLTIADISSVELVAQMKIGWNLGNTLDASGGMGIMSEMAWGNPKTKQEMIDAVLEQGFNVIRIPVTWDGHFGEAPEYKIHDIWLQRVKEVVDYAYNKGAYVILNTHHEEWYFPSEENKETNAEQITALWTQIAEYFKEYDEHLIFEGLNEPRKRGTSVEWTGDGEAREVINYWEQVFVETVRATGGNNTLRHLMITGYAASSSRTNLAAMKLPEDDKLIVSVHAYTPYNFALNKNGTATWDVTKDARDIDTLMKDLNELFISKGIPVIIGEFGAMNKENEAERVEWVTYYLTKAEEIGVPCVWWDNNAFTGSGENFGIFDRRELIFPYPDLLAAMMEAVNRENVADGAGE